MTPGSPPRWTRRGRPNFFSSRVNPTEGLSVLYAMAAQEDLSRGHQGGGPVAPGGLGDSLAVALAGSAVDGTSGPDDTDPTRVGPVGCEHRPQGGTEEATVGLRQGGCRSQEEFGLVLCDVFHTDYRKLVGLAAIWLGGAAEDAVQDAFVHVWSSWERVQDGRKILLYLRRAVVNNAMSELRHQRVVRRVHPGLSRREPLNEDGGRLMWSSTAPLGTDEEALRQVADDAVIVSIRRLAPQQAACIALRFYLDLSEKEIAEVRGIRTGTVKKHISRAMRNLRPLLEENDD